MANEGIRLYMAELTHNMAARLQKTPEINRQELQTFAENIHEMWELVEYLSGFSTELTESSLTPFQTFDEEVQNILTHAQEADQDISKQNGRSV